MASPSPIPCSKEVVLSQVARALAQVSPEHRGSVLCFLYKITSSFPERSRLKTVQAEYWKTAEGWKDCKFPVQTWKQTHTALSLEEMSSYELSYTENAKMHQEWRK